MYSKFWPRGGLPGILHHFTETLVAFEFTSKGSPKPHSLLFVGGLGDGIATTAYVADLEEALRPTPWSLFALNLTSSFQSWGLGHLDRDTDELAQCLNYIKEYKTGEPGAGKVVLMGHSTGSQMVLHYLYRPNPHQTRYAFDPTLEHVIRPVLDGAIMQAPVSDREVIKLVISEGWTGKTTSECQQIYDELEAIAKEVDLHGQSVDTLLPISLTSLIGYPANTPVSARRFLSLNSPESPLQPREDDLFSSDLTQEQLSKTFGRIGKAGLLRSKLLVLFSGADQSVPASVDKQRMLAQWQNAANADGQIVWDEQNSGVIPNASHALSNDDQAPCREDLVRRVKAYLQTVEKV